MIRLTLFLAMFSFAVHASTPVYDDFDAHKSYLAYFSKDKKRKPCDNSPGLADSHVLALSWQPGFCETYGYEAGKSECLQLAPDTYQANHLVLHGLWPNQKNCGVRYGYCGVRFKSRHCDYSPVQLSDAVAEDLRQFMPSFAYGSCLERHEWSKHGSCQILSADNYFSLAMQLTRGANQTTLAEFLSEHRGETVGRTELRREVVKAFGEEAAHKVFLGCKNGMLVDVFIQLPALIPQTESLETLMYKAPDVARNDACPEKIGISDFNNETWAL